MSKRYQVHEFADLAGVTVKALHHYDRLGLLKPARTEAGYRLYGPGDLERLEQIVALKFLGLPLKQIRIVLDRGALPLPDALRMQRQVLEDQRVRLDRAIGAIEEAEKGVAPGGPSDAAVLKKLIEVIGMQNDVDVMKRYFSEDAWERCRGHFAQWPSDDEWRILYRDVEASLGEDPAGPAAQVLAARWVELTNRDAGGDPAARAGFWRAWADREHWPAALRQKMAEFKVDALASFVAKAAWEFYEHEREEQSAGVHRVPDRVSDARIVLFRDVEASLGEDPAGPVAQALVARWRALVEEETGGDSEAASAVREMWAGRHTWPDSFRRYVASLYRMEPEAWTRVSDFIEQALAR